MSSTTTTNELHDPTSAAYKKARRNYLKTTRNRSAHTDAEWTAFRAAEKRYKARFPPPDLSSVLDLALLDEGRAGEVERGIWRGTVGGAATPFREVPLRDEEGTGRRAYVFPGRPGLVVLPSFVPPAEQRHLVRWALRDHARTPNETNLDTHYLLPQEGLWNRFLVERQRPETEAELILPRASTSTSTPPAQPDAPGPRKLISNEPATRENYLALSAAPKAPPAPSTTAQPARAVALLPRLRWANIGWYYHWGIKQYDFARGKEHVDPRLRGVCKSAVRAVKWDDVFAGEAESGWGEEGRAWEAWEETYEPDAGIVNFYQTKDTLMSHVDRSEVCATSPLVSISLGCAAVFLIGGLTRDEDPTPILLRSGDVVIMSGPACRRAYHGVPRILEDTMPPHFDPEEGDGEWEPYTEYLRTTRINVNVRQVFPKDFVPALDAL